MCRLLAGSEVAQLRKENTELKARLARLETEAPRPLKAQTAQTETQRGSHVMVTPPPLPKKMPQTAPKKLNSGGATERDRQADSVGGVTQESLR